MELKQQFVTQPKHKNPLQQQLQKYVNSISKKINNAKWKQDQVLKYNYMPLTNIQQKTATKLHKQQANYIKRNRELEIQLNTQKIQRDMEHFKQFQNKLRNKINQIQVMIEDKQMAINLLKLQVQDRRDSLKEIIRENMGLGKIIFSQQQQRIRNVNQAHTQRKFVKTLSLKNKIQQSSQSKFKRNTSRISTRYSTKNSRLTQYKDSYQQCLDAIIKSMRKMQATQDVQQGIYLDIMSKKKPSLVGKYSLRSKICDTLIQRYGKLRLKPKPKGEEDFYISWQAFKQLNWKQIMGVIMVRDKNCQKMRHLLEVGIR